MDIKVYTAPTCPYCKLVKDYLKEHKLKFREIDITLSTNNAKESIRLSGQMGVPVLSVNGKVIVGWNKDAIEELLKKENV